MSGIAAELIGGLLAVAGLIGGAFGLWFKGKSTGINQEKQKQAVATAENLIRDHETKRQIQDEVQEHIITDDVYARVDELLKQANPYDD